MFYSLSKFEDRMENNIAIVLIPPIHERKKMWFWKMVIYTNWMVNTSEKIDSQPNTIEFKKK